MWCPALLLVLVSLALSDDAIDFHKNLPAQVVWAVSGQDALLPCNVTPPSASDHVNMVLWFKDLGVSIYSLDARDRPLQDGVHLATTDDLGERLFFQATVGSGTAVLRIKNVSVADEGVFRCRVDFRNSPTVNFRLNLTIVEPPSMPVIYDAGGVEVTGMAGPFLEGFDLNLECRVKGGRPRPEVTWWQGGLLRDSSVDFMSADETVNRLFVKVIHRSLWNNFLECRARSTTRSPPLVRRVQLDVYLKPKGVQVVTEEKLLSAGKLHNLTCTTWGSVPPARITWFLDGEPLRHPQTKEEETFNTTTSTLMFRPGAMDFGKELACRAENPHFQGGVFEDRRKLYVAYPPAVFVQLETNSAASSLKEGDDVRLMCEVRSNPQPDRVTWFHGDRPLYANDSAGIIPSQRTLMLKGLTRTSGGEYSCAAANREGETRSAPIRIRVQYAPRCRSGREFVTIGALRHDPVKVLCEVDADPGDEDLRFSWTLQRGREVLPLPGTRAVKRGAISELVYTPVAEADFGTLACWASNSVGRQEASCKFNIIQARTPQPPGSCVVRNDSMTAALEVACSPGDDGGLAQHFVLEVRSEEQESQEPGAMSDQPPLGPPLHALRGPTPHFTVQGLKPGARYRLDVFAENRKGRSHPPVLLSRVAVWPGTQSLKGFGTQILGEDDTKDSKASKATQPMAVVLAVLVAAAAIIVVGVFTTAALVMCRRRRLQRRLKKERTSYRVRFSADPPISVQDEGGGRTSLEPDLIVSRAQMTMENT